MATRHQLQSAFAELADVLGEGFDPSAQQDVQERWLGATIRLASVARRDEWLTIAADCDLYTPLTNQLATIAAALHDPGGIEQTIAKLDLVDMAIGLVTEVLETDPCASLG